MGCIAGLKLTSLTTHPSSVAGHAGIVLVAMRQRAQMVCILTFMTLVLSTEALSGPISADGLPVRALKQFGETLST